MRNGSAAFNGGLEVMTGILSLLSRKAHSNGETAHEASDGAMAVWTPKGYVITVKPQKTEIADDRRAGLGMSGYGGNDASPPGTGYGQGRVYD
jgi:hypothetical protein